MLTISRRLAPMAIIFTALLLGATAALHSRAGTAQSIAPPNSLPKSQSKSAVSDSSSSSRDDAQALRCNTLGVAYMNQQRPADAQKLFEQALQADPNFAVAKVNLGIALLAQQKPEASRGALVAGAEQRPDDPYAWYNLGLVYKDLSEQEKGIAAFEHVTQIAPNEADAYYFVGYLYTQLQKYDQAIAAFQKALAIFPYHASSEFGLARAYQRSGNIDAAKEHLAKFQKVTSEHLGAPFGAGYGDQGRFSYAEFARGEGQVAPAPIPVTYSWESVGSAIANNADLAVAPGPGFGACFFDFDGQGRPGLFLPAGSPGSSGVLLRTNPGGRFEDASANSGIDVKSAAL